MKLKKPEFNIHPHDFMIIFKANYKYDYNPMLDADAQNVPLNLRYFGVGFLITPCFMGSFLHAKSKAQSIKTLVI